LIASCWVGLFFELIRAVPYVMMQMDMMPIMEEHVPRMVESMRASGNAGAAAGAQIGAAFARSMLVAGIVFYCGWGLAKLLFYGFSIRYLRGFRLLAVAFDGSAKGASPPVDRL
jgi:hypothetical protein